MLSISQQLGEQICSSLLGFHAVTGCDSTSSLAGISKKKALKILLGNISYQEALAKLGESPEIPEDVLTACEKFICNLYTAAKKAGSKVNDVRYWMFY